MQYVAVGVACVIALLIGVALNNVVTRTAPPGDPLYYWRFVVAVAEMVGVVGAVVLALWDRLRPYFFRPKLTFSLRDAGAIVEELLETRGATEDDVRFCCDLIVSNTSRVAATGCRLAVANCRKFAGEEEVDLVRRLEPTPTPWPNSQSTTDVHHGLPIVLRLFTVQAQPSLGVATSGDRLGALQLHLIRAEGSQDPLVLSDGDYKLRFAVVASGGIRADLVLKLTYKGTWHKRLAQMKQDLAVTSVQT